LDNKGSGVFDVRRGSGESVYVQLPGKFKQAVFVRKGGYCLIAVDEASTDKVRGRVVTILTPDQVKQLRKTAQWYVFT